MMAVTHELKTPIAVTQLNLETLQKRKLEEAQQQKIISSTLKEANRLNELTNNILVASQLEAGAYYLNKQEVNLSEIAEESFKEFEQRFPARELQKKIQPDLYVEGEQLLLHLLINNLLDNAIKYSPAEKTVLLALEEKNKEVKLSVTDEGVGISDAEKKRVFDKFYRIGSESTRTAKGTGLGLYLCKKIVHEFKGAITIENNKPQGSIFTVILKQLPHE
jgi:signal transduction histidine kinase